MQIFTIVSFTTLKKNYQFTNNCRNVIFSCCCKNNKMTYLYAMPHNSATGIPRCQSQAWKKEERVAILLVQPQS